MTDFDAQGHDRPDGRASRRRERGILVATVLGSSLSFVDGSVVNVALPALRSGLGAAPADLSWVVNAYLLPLGALILIGGAAGDRYGRRLVFTLGVLVFLLGSLGAALAPAIEWLIAARALQGIGSALLVPSSLAIISLAFTGAARGRAIGIWAAAGAIAGAFGPPLGGWLTEHVSWRAIFAINLPLGLAAIVFARAFVAKGQARDAVALDWPGAILVTLGLGALTWGLTLLSAGEGGGTGGLLVAAVVLLAAFVWTEHARADEAMVPLALFAIAAFSGVNLLTFLVYGALAGLTVLLPFLMIEVQGFSPTLAGAGLLPLPLIIGVLSPAMGGLAHRLGVRTVLTAGPFIVAAGFAAFGLVGIERAYAATILPGLTLVALGMAVTVAPLTTAVMSTVGDERAGIASGINNAVARIAGLVVVALLGLVLVVDPGQPALFIAHVHAAAWVGAGLCLAGALIGFVSMPSLRSGAR